jgi:hypothetical protein
MCIPGEGMGNSVGCAAAERDVRMKTRWMYFFKTVFGFYGDVVRTDVHGIKGQIHTERLRANVTFV